MLPAQNGETTRNNTPFMKQIAFLIFSLAALPCLAQTDVSSFLSGTAEGAVYSLPATTIEITVDAICVKRTPGEFHRYADKFLRLNNVISAEEKYWELQNVNVELTGKADPQKMFTVKLNNSTASNLQLTEEGILAGINTDNHKEETAPLVAAAKRKSIDARQYMTEEILQATSTAKMAELVAKEIYSIRESKLAIVKGQAENMPQDGVSMQLVLDELDKQEKAYLALFTGTTDTTSVSRKIYFTPTAESDTVKSILFRFSRKLGVVDNENLAGAPVYYDFRNLNSVYIPLPDEVKKPLKKEGICYNVPGKAEFRIYTTIKALYNSELPIAQLGTTEILSKALFNKGARTKVTFDTATGAIINIEKQ